MLQFEIFVQRLNDVIRKRNLIYPTLVQGASAAPNIAENINWQIASICHVLIVGRGGGSIEDLWAFNEEVVARAIFESRIPIISAVGHETDTTIADFVSDFTSTNTNCSCGNRRTKSAENCINKYYKAVQFIN